MKLTPSFFAVLKAMTQPDPRPQRGDDNPVEAIARRLPGISRDELVHTLRALNALGLTWVVFLAGMVSARVTQNPKDWITEKGWTVIGTDSFSSKN